MKNYVVISAAAAIICDLIACIGDSNAVIYTLFMGLSCASFCIYVAGLIYNGIIRDRRKVAKKNVRESNALRNAA